MCEQALALSAGADVFIGAAAVADYRVESAPAEKIKKADGAPLTLTLVENPDIIACVAQAASRPAMVVGFAAETESLMDHAREKRQRKGLDMIIANDVSDPDTTFGSEQNAVHLITEAQEQSLPWPANGSSQNRLLPPLPRRSIANSCVPVSPVAF